MELKNLLGPAIDWLLENARGQEAELLRFISGDGLTISTELEGKRYVIDLGIPREMVHFYHANPEWDSSPQWYYNPAYASMGACGVRLDVTEVVVHDQLQDLAQYSARPKNSKPQLMTRTLTLVTCKNCLRSRVFKATLALAEAGNYVPVEVDLEIPQHIRIMGEEEEGEEDYLPFTRGDAVTVDPDGTVRVSGPVPWPIGTALSPEHQPFPAEFSALPGMSEETLQDVIDCCSREINREGGHRLHITTQHWRALLHAAQVSLRNILGESD